MAISLQYRIITPTALLTDSEAAPGQDPVAVPLKAEAPACGVWLSHSREQVVIRRGKTDCRPPP